MRVLELPQTVDDPPYLLMWRVDDLMPVVAGFGLGMAFGELLVLASMGIAASYFYRRFRDGRPDGYVFHLLYWFGFVPARGRLAGNPFERVFLP